MTPRRLIRYTAASLAALLIAGCTGGADDPADTAEPQVQTEVITDSLQAPWSIAFFGDTPLISERDTGRILELDSGGETREVATVAGVAPGGEAGLLGLAIRDSDLYVYFTTDRDNRVNRYPLLGEPGSLGLGEPETIIDSIPAARIHNGGRIAFGPDGMLYIPTGDAAQPANSQDLGSTAGKILRITPDGEIPADNPFEGSPVYSYGHRNSQGLAWAPDGTMFASEFGANTWDELNVITAGGNYGWPAVEGIGGDPAYLDPVQQWRPADASPSGITVADGTIYMTSLRGGRLHEIPVADPTTSSDRYAGEFGRLRDVTVAPDGRLWLLTNNTDGGGTPRDGDDQIIAVPLG